MHTELFQCSFVVIFVSVGCLLGLIQVRSIWPSAVQDCKRVWKPLQAVLFRCATATSSWYIWYMLDIVRVGLRISFGYIIYVVGHSWVFYSCEAVLLFICCLINSLQNKILYNLAHIVAYVCCAFSRYANCWDESLSVSNPIQR